MADSHTEPWIDPTFRAAGPGNQPNQPSLVCRHVEGRPEQRLELEPEEEIGAVPTTPFTTPRSADVRDRVAAPNPFGGDR